MNNCIDLLNNLKKKHKEITKKINTDKSVILKLANEIKKTLSDEEYLKLYQERFGKLTENAKRQVLEYYHHTITEEEWKNIVDAFMQFKDWEPPSNGISNEGLDMDAFTEEEIEYLEKYEKEYHSLTEEEKEEIIKERRRKLGKRT